MKISSNCHLQINAPFHTQIETIEHFISSKYSWIQRKLKEQASRKKSTKLCYKNGEKHRFMGTEYPLQLIPSNQNTVKIEQGHIYVYHRTRSSVKNILKEWYRQQALTHLAQRTKIFADRHQLPTIKTIKVRYMKARWGSCTSDAVITYNVHLIKACPANIDYVILHELCHLIHPNHSAKFYQLQSQLNPDWKYQKNNLNQSNIIF